MTRISRRSILTGTLLAPAITLGAGAMPTAAATPTATTATTARASGATRRITVYAEPLGDGQYGYGLAPGKASIPGPVLEIVEGDTLEIELVNSTDRRLSIHPHGVDYTIDSDGAPLHLSFNEPGETRVYTWDTHVARQGPGDFWIPGSAGYWHYHDHAMDGEHGTAGVRAGLYGGLVVRRAGDPLPDKQFTVVFNDMTVNNLPAHETPPFEANLGERVEFLAIGHGDTFHTFHLHGHRWANNRTGLLHGPDDPSQVVDTRDLNPGDSFGFQVIAGDAVGPGVWMYHCHVQFHSDGGMVGLFLVRNEDGSMPAGAQETIDRFHGHTAAGTHDATRSDDNAAMHHGAAMHDDGDPAAAHRDH